MKDKHELVRQYIQKSTETLHKMAQEQSEILVRISEELVRILRAGGVIYLCGNGGSAADAQHTAAEIVGRFLRQRKALPAVALTTDSSILTAVGNDYGFEEIFARQVQALATDRDVLLGISTSGRSPNVIRAMYAAKEIGALTVGFTGTPGEPLASTTDLCLCVPCGHTPHIQEAHIMALHVICDLVERNF